ncbi:MAG: acyl-CoA dehydrogenase family protein [Maricaulis sp.]|jgi:alkylation response protein AidB-like acyl-CoA dehydrogenase|uniref:acyl-CoA dehydrogenase family protein n=1 Tax=Maricaulis sp. TaxID=1486257 RepID=UPI001B05B11C|nr:acyl-CoA dehydrogenase family protein [Maricaulis sp.]MBO6728718.1 acyl-CoA dehydrogenase family protein [Maricaulis sp.]MBO6847345.1 acyl-CoA dehydrogenase family protein [Maricaulis sp.]MBO6876455.1 acyl-CoA dehydrogenase family protein [Maricaulis sp.]
MAMVLSEEAGMLKDAAKGFLADSAPVSQLRRLRDEESADGFDRSTWKDMAEMGWTSVLVPEEHGGVAMGHVAAGVIAEEMGRTLTASPYLSTAIMGATALSRFGSDAQKGEWLPRIAAGDAITAVAVDEGRKHNPVNVTTQAERSGNGFKLTGAKSFVAEGHIADMLIVSARTAGGDAEEEGISLFLVPQDAAGVKIQRASMVDSRNSARIELDGVEVDADALLGEVDAGYKPLESILDSGRAGLAAEMSGSAQECLHQTVEYLKERKQFGEIIGTYQGLQHRAAHLYSEIELGKSIVLKTLQTLDMAPDHAAMMVSAAKSKMGQVAQLAAQESIQMHGGIGMTDEYDIGFFIKRVRVAEALFGDANYHTDKFARMRNY